jgi:hypothetical protein
MKIKNLDSLSLRVYCSKEINCKANMKCQLMQKNNQINQLNLKVIDLIRDAREKEQIITEYEMKLIGLDQMINEKESVDKTEENILKKRKLDQLVLL